MREHGFRDSYPADVWDLPVTEAHVWQAFLDEPSACAWGEDKWNVLAEDERIRAARYTSAVDRRRFRLVRLLLRSLVGAYTHVAPERVVFAYGPHGKPGLAAEGEGGEIQFNVTHTQDVALVAMTRARAIGVDVEYVQPLDELEAIAERFFSADERRALRTLPNERRLRAFYQCWTRKEAYIKATGQGVSCALDSFAVSLGPGVPAQLIHLDGDYHAAQRWSLVELPMEPSRIASLAYEGHGLALKRWTWHWETT